MYTLLGVTSQSLDVDSRNVYNLHYYTKDVQIILYTVFSNRRI